MYICENVLLGDIHYHKSNNIQCSTGKRENLTAILF